MPQFIILVAKGLPFDVNRLKKADSRATMPTITMDERPNSFFYCFLSLLTLLPTYRYVFTYITRITC